MDTASALMKGVHFDAGAVNFDFENGYEYVSGMRAPVYIDNRKLFHESRNRAKVVVSLNTLVKSENLSYDVLGGVATGAIAPAMLLADELGAAFVYVRSKQKDHGLKRLVECGDIRGKNVLLIEDMVTTGGSSINAVEAIKKEGGMITDCITITSFGFAEAAQAFNDVGVKLRSLLSVASLAEEAASRGLISEEQKASVLAWLKNPYESWE